MSTAPPDTQHALSGLYADHHSWLKGWLRRKLGDTFLAADLAQDTFISLITGLGNGGNGEPIRSPRPFLATIARRLASHHHRRQLLQSSYLEWLAAQPETLAPSPEAHLQAIQALQQIDQALDGLPAEVREAFLLAHLEELSYPEIGTRLGVSLSTVKRYLTRANRHCLFLIEL